MAMQYAGAWFLLAVTCSLHAAVDPDLPSLAPTVRSIFPHGAQRGTTVEVQLSGDNLHDAQSVEFAGRGVTAAILSSSRTKLKLKVAAETTSEVGRRDFRLITRRGVYVGVFDIGALPEITEKEDNDDWRKAGTLTLPVLVNGVLGNEDWDHFRVRATAGETLVFDLSAARHGSRLDADLAILDDNGEELAWNDDTTIFADPHLEHTFQRAGDYVIRVGSLTGGSDYRLSIGHLPYVRRTLPAGLGIGRATILRLDGAHMDLADEVWIGDRMARGQIIQKSADVLKVRFLLAKNVPSGNYRIHASARGREIAIPTEIRVSALPEVTVARAPSALASALPVTHSSSVVNGVLDRSKATHYFSFTAKAGETYLFQAESMKLGYHLDPALTLLDAGGNKLTSADDPGADERTDEYQLDVDLSYTFSITGTYYLAIRDAMYRGGDQLVYRLTIQRTPPDFILELREPVKTFYQGQEGNLHIRVRRRAGWTAPIEVWAEGLPEGVKTERRTVEPKDSIVKDTCGNDRILDGSIVLLPLRLEQIAHEGRFDLKIRARGEMNGAVVEHEGIVRYQNGAAGLIYGPMQVQRAQVTVLPPPDVILTPSETFSLAPGSEKTINVPVRRFGGARQTDVLIRARQVPSGFTIDPVRLPSAEKTASLRVRAASESASASIEFEAISIAESKVLGLSAPVLLEVKQTAEGKK